MYAKLSNGVLTYAPRKIKYNNNIVFNPTEAMLIELGYLEVVNTDYPSDGNYYTSSYEVQNNQIVQVWTLAEEPVVEPTLDERVTDVENTLNIIVKGE